MRFRQGHGNRNVSYRPLYIEDPVTGCWVWQRAKATNGYGHFRGTTAHRWFYEQRFGPLPPGIEPDHTCRNRACVNPDHMEPVTRAENTRRGDVEVKLTPDGVRLMRAQLAQGMPLAEAARRHGVSWARVREIRDRVGWPDV